MTRILILLVALTISGCRHSQPPRISIICTGDGAGGADCVTDAGVRVYKSPSELKNFWMTTQPDQANFTAWCYDTSVEQVSKIMELKRLQITGEDLK